MSPRELALLLYNVGCIKIGEFKLTSGLTSPIYIDLRILPSYPEAFKKVVKSVANVLASMEFDVVCGLALGGIPLATAIAYELSKPLIYVRKEEKKHGLKKLIEGAVEEGLKAILIDDVATTGGTLARGVEVLRKAGLVVEDAVVVVDRAQGACEKLSSMGVRLLSLISLPQLVEILHHENLIPPSLYEKIMSCLGGGSRV